MGSLNIPKVIRGRRRDDIGISLRPVDWNFSTADNHKVDIPVPFDLFHCSYNHWLRKLTSKLDLRMSDPMDLSQGPEPTAAMTARRSFKTAPE